MAGSSRQASSRYAFRDGPSKAAASENTRLTAGHRSGWISSPSFTASPSLFRAKPEKAPEVTVGQGLMVARFTVAYPIKNTSPGGQVVITGRSRARQSSLPRALRQRRPGFQIAVDRSEERRVGKERCTLWS